MSSSIGSTPQFQPSLIQNSVQKNAEQAIQRDAQQSNAPVAKAQANGNFQKLAEEIIAKRASGESVQQGAGERGQVVDLLV